MVTLRSASSMRYWLFLSVEESNYDIKQDGQHDAEKDRADQWNQAGEAGPLDADVARQVAQEGDFREQL
jgi:hypothetical protein